jgi:Bacterial Ig-like domain
MRWMAGIVLQLVLASCYDVPRPACGFRCAADGACPASYACATDGYCHARGSSPSLTCPLVDAGIDAFDFWPFIQEVSPLDDAKAVPITTNATVKFTEQVIGISATTFTLVVEGDTTPVAATVTYDLATRTATLDPDTQLLSSKHYVAALGDGIEDARGNPIYGKRTWRFRTAHDTEAPTLVSIDPAPGTTGVAINAPIVMVFSEQVQYPNGGFILSDGTTQQQLTPMYVSPVSLKFQPLALQPQTLYTVTITAQVTDLTGNPFANAPVNVTFTTAADTIPPTVLLTSPPDGDVIDIGLALYAVFSEDVTGVSATTMTITTGATVLPATVTYDPLNKRARITPTAPLQHDTSYTIHLGSGISDTHGNALAPYTWSFETDP